MGDGIWGNAFGWLGQGCAIGGLGFWVLGLRFGAEGLGFGAHGLWFRVQRERERGREVYG